MKYIVDIDGTIFSDTHNGNYHEARPLTDRIAHFNNLYDQGHEIHYWTARGSESGIDRTQLTMQQLAQWVKEGKIKTTETIEHGFENLPKALLGLFKGKNTGKMIVKA